MIPELIIYASRRIIVYTSGRCNNLLRCRCQYLYEEPSLGMLFYVYIVFFYCIIYLLFKCTYFYIKCHFYFLKLIIIIRGNSFSGFFKYLSILYAFSLCCADSSCVFIGYLFPQKLSIKLFVCWSIQQTPSFAYMCGPLSAHMMSSEFPVAVFLYRYFIIVGIFVLDMSITYLCKQFCGHKFLKIEGLK